MERKSPIASPPVPVCKCFITCKQIYVDDVTQDVSLVAPIHQLFDCEFPVTVDLSFFARWSNAHGVYRVELQLRTLEGEAVWHEVIGRPFEVFDPLQNCPVLLRHLKVNIPGPGKYEWVLLANAEEVASDVLLVHNTVESSEVDHEPGMN